MNEELTKELNALQEKFNKEEIINALIKLK